VSKFQSVTDQKLYAVKSVNKSLLRQKQNKRISEIEVYCMRYFSKHCTRFTSRLHAMTSDDR